jgi:hypothetical protein
MKCRKGLYSLPEQREKLRNMKSPYLDYVETVEFLCERHGLACQGKTAPSPIPWADHPEQLAP